MERSGIRHSILDAIGKTPLLRLKRSRSPFRVPIARLAAAHAALAE